MYRPHVRAACDRIMKAHKRELVGIFLSAEVAGKIVPEKKDKASGSGKDWKKRGEGAACCRRGPRLGWEKSRAAPSRVVPPPLPPRFVSL